jgi:hypothetical protein
MDPLVQVAGALLVLAAYLLLQVGVVTQRSRLYTWFNLIGASVLAVDAFVEEQWGFLLLEGVWALIAAVGLVRLADAADRSYDRASTRSRSAPVPTSRTGTSSSRSTNST